MQAKTRPLGTAPEKKPLRLTHKTRLTRSTFIYFIVTICLFAASVLAILPSVINHIHIHAAAPANAAVTTYKADNGRTGSKV